MATKGFTPVDDPATPKGFTPVDQPVSQPTNEVQQKRQAILSGLKETPVGRFATNMGEDFVGAIKTPYDIGKDVVTRFPESVFGKDTTYSRFYDEPSERTSQEANVAFQKAGSALGKGDVYEGARDLAGSAGYAVSSVLPGGPWVASKGEQMARGDVAGGLGGLAGGAAGGYALSKAGDIQKTSMDFVRRATSLNDVTKAGSGVYQGTIQPLFDTLRGSIQNEGARTIQQAIEADKKASMVQGRGTISPSSAVAAASEAIEETGHQPTPQTRTLLNRLNNSSFLTLEDAKNLRSDFGEAASRADRAKNAKLGKILWTAYDELGEGMKGRIKELQGTEEPFNHYNNEFKAYYELKKGIAGSMMDSIMDRHESIPKLKEFREADLTEIKDQAKKYGLDPSKFDEAQKNARSVSAAHDSISGKYSKSVYKLALGGGVAGGTALSIYAAAHGAGLYGLAPMLGASYIAGKIAGIPDQMETGRILRKLNLDPEAFQVRTPVEGPKTFDYPDQDQVYGSMAKSISPEPSPMPSADVTPAGRPVPEQIKRIQQAKGGRGVSPDIGSWQPPPELGVGSAPDYGQKARADVQAKMGPLERSGKAEAIKKVKRGK